MRERSIEPSHPRHARQPILRTDSLLRLNKYCGTAGHKKEHRLAVATELGIVKINSHNRVSACAVSLAPEFSQAGATRIPEYGLHRLTPAAEKIRHPCEEVAKNVDSKYALSGDNFQSANYANAFESVCSGERYCFKSSILSLPWVSLKVLRFSVKSSCIATSARAGEEVRSAIRASRRGAADDFTANRTRNVDADDWLRHDVIISRYGGLATPRARRYRDRVAQGRTGAGGVCYRGLLRARMSRFASIAFRSCARASAFAS